MSDESTITGKGHDILLPPQGNPFKKGSAAEEPTDLGPAEIAARFGKAPLETATEAEQPVEEPTDLSPEDITALFPAAPEEGVASPISETEAAAIQAAGERPPIGLSAPPRWQKIASARPDVAVEASESPSEVDLASFNPDAPIGASSTPPAEVAPETLATETPPLSPAAAISDTPSPLVDVSPLTDVPAAESLAPAQPTSPEAPLSMPTTASSTITSSPTGPVVGFQPYDPFAPVASLSPPESTSPISEAPAASSPSSTPAEVIAAVTASPRAPGETVTAMVASPASPGKPAAMTAVAVTPAPYDDEPTTGDHGDMLPIAPTIAFPIPEDWTIVNMLITDEKIGQLWQRIDVAEKEAVSHDSSLPKQRTSNFENLKTARNLLLGGRQNYEDALRYVAEVESDLFYAGRVRKWSYSYGALVLLYNLIWIVLLVFAYGMSKPLTEAFARGGVIDVSNALAVWVTILSGGLGGVSKSLFALHKHVTNQDFDKQHLMWYFTCPILGTVLGIFVYMFAQQIIVRGGGAAGLQGADLSNMVDQAGFVFYLLAWVVGFQQNLILELVEKVKKVLLPEKEGEKPAK